MIRVLIADDHQLLIDGIKTTLEDVEWIKVVKGVLNGNDVLKFLKRKRVDVILMDINMPELDGLECTKIVAREYPEIKILAISQYDERRFIRQMIKNGASGYLLKDSGKNELVEAIKTAVDGRQYFSDRLSDKILGKSEPINKRNPLFIKLTDREQEILSLLCMEYSSQEISEKLLISFHTVETHRANLMAKSGAKNSIGLVKWALENELV
ncbi:MAG: response regulator transcription factor [Bacteroidales bacterium]|nr:response regulator transcription factor [Bacteroidales bacterium]MCF8404079.1 response regulator transcription factor [Bacteroidales bacterium]